MPDFPPVASTDAEGGGTGGNVKRRHPISDPVVSQMRSRLGGLLFRTWKLKNVNQDRSILGDPDLDSFREISKLKSFVENGQFLIPMGYTARTLMKLGKYLCKIISQSVENMIASFM